MFTSSVKTGFVSIAAMILLMGIAFPAFGQQATVEIRTPKTPATKPLDRAGQGGVGWVVDLKIEFRTPLAATGFTAPQLTGPGAHASTTPFPGTFSFGKDDRLPGLIVLVSTTRATAGGSCHNVANLFNLTGLIDLNAASPKAVFQDVWVVGSPIFGKRRNTQIYATIARDKNGNGIFDDAPATVPDSNGDGICNAVDLRAFGVVSNIATTRVFLNP